MTRSRRMPRSHLADLDLARDVISRAKGFGQVECMLVQGETTMVRVGRGEVEQLSKAVSRGLGVRVIQAGRMGYCYSSDLSREGIEEALKGARALAQSADSDPYRSLPEAEPVGSEDLEILDERFDEMSIEEKIALTTEMERAALAIDPRIVATMRATYSDARSNIALANSQGFAETYQRTSAAGWIQAVARDDSSQSMGIGLDFAVSPRELDPRQIGKEAGRRAVDVLGGKPLPTQKGTIILHPLAAAELLVFLAQAVVAEALQKGRSFLIDRLGEEVASAIVDLSDHGRRRGGLASVPFDGEGTPTRLTRVVHRGVFQQPLHDHYTARKEGTRSTGNAARESHRDIPRVAPSNFYLEPSDTPAERLLEEVPRGLYVLQTMNVGGVNPATGDYSVGASGVWIENGSPVKPVSGVTIAGHLSDILKNIVAVASDLRFIPLFGSIGSPTLRIEDLTIAGL